MLKEINKINNISYTVKRNPILSVIINEIEYKIQTIGDVHLGKSFKTGVPYHKLGEREQSQLQLLEQLLAPVDSTIIAVILMGDLFDKAIVSNNVVKDFYNLITVAAENNPLVSYIILDGNHVLSKENTKTTSFDILTLLLENVKNINVVNKNQVVEIVPNLHLYLDCYDPYNSYSSVEEIVLSEIKQDKNNTLISFGHWDTFEFTETGYYPNQHILSYSDLTCSGHIHIPMEYTYNYVNKESGISLKGKTLITGSMQPYSHSEDPEKLLYITIKSNELDKYNLSEDFKNKCVRIDCDSLFILSEPVDCLSLTLRVVETKKEQVAIETEDESVEEVSENFNSALIKKVETFQHLETITKQELLDLLKNKTYLD